MVDDTDDGADEPDDDGPAEAGTGASGDSSSTRGQGDDRGANADGQRGGRSGGQEPPHDREPDRRDEIQPPSSSRTGREPHVSLTIEGEYESVFNRVEHPQGFQHTELDRIMDNVESTLRAVVGTGGGIRSEIYDEVDFELDDPWEIRKYLEVLEMHDLIRLHDDRWIPSDYFDRNEDSN